MRASSLLRLAPVALLAACSTDTSGVRVEQDFPSFDTGGGFQGNRERAGTLGEMFGGQVGNVTFGEGPRDALAGNVNRHLWRASLDTLSFLPIASTDPFTGVIATDWAASPTSPEERFKVTAYVTDVTLNPNSLRVAVFRETRSGDGWTPAPVADETPRQIEDAILVRARQLRLAEQEAEAAG
jgi:hypothetical protein